jgi:transcriptional regulator with XRE-family HTH domain
MGRSKAIRSIKSSRRKLPIKSAAVGHFFSQKRREAGLSESEVVAYLEDVTVETLKRYESGELKIPLNHIYALSNCLNVAPREVMEIIEKVDLK